MPAGLQKHVLTVCVQTCCNNCQWSGDAIRLVSLPLKFSWSDQFQHIQRAKYHTKGLKQLDRVFLFFKIPEPTRWIIWSFWIGLICVSQNGLLICSPAFDVWHLFYVILPLHGFLEIHVQPHVMCISVCLCSLWSLCCILYWLFTLYQEFVYRNLYWVLINAKKNMMTS